MFASSRTWANRVRTEFMSAEWAEGAVLEPTDRYGRTYLLAVRDVLAGGPTGVGPSATLVGA